MSWTPLPYTEDVARATAPLYEKLADQYAENTWQLLAPYIYEINRLKKEKNAVILAHNYMTPDIFFGVGDVVGDSLKLAQEAAKSDADIIIQAGVHFMAETAKILNMDKIVLMPDMKAGCSLAESITADDVRALRKQYPGVPIVTYVNTSAEVKAESDVCCTSSNVVKIVNALDADEVLVIPDRYLAANTQAQTDKKIHTWERGACEVHERFRVSDITQIRERNEGIVVLAHPECPRDVIEASDYSGSTAQMIDFVAKNRPQKAALITECSMSDNIKAELPELELLTPCRLCPHMKRISLPKILSCLQTLEPRIEVDPGIAVRARKAIDRMLELS